MAAVVLIDWEGSLYSVEPVTDPGPLAWTLTKRVGGTDPERVAYRVSLLSGRWMCDCQGFTRWQGKPGYECRHIKGLRAAGRTFTRRD